MLCIRPDCSGPVASAQTARCAHVQCAACAERTVTFSCLTQLAEGSNLAQTVRVLAAVGFWWRLLFGARSNAHATMNLQLTVRSWEAQQCQWRGHCWHTAGTAEYSGTNTSWLTRLAEENLEQAAE